MAQETKFVKRERKLYSAVEAIDGSGVKIFDGEDQISATQVRDKLQTLSGNDRLESSAIKGLADGSTIVEIKEATISFNPGSTNWRDTTIDIPSASEHPWLIAEFENGRSFWIKTSDLTAMTAGTVGSNDGTSIRFPDAHGTIDFYLGRTAANRLLIRATTASYTGSETLHLWEVGPVGSQGPQGPQGIQGPRGQAGMDGHRGADGAQGYQGRYRFNIYRYVNADATAPTTPTGGSVSGGVLTAPNNWSKDFPSAQASDPAMYDVYQSFAIYDPAGDSGAGELSSWSVPYTIGGEAGPQGPQGPKGDKGDAGPVGPQGPQGPAEVTFTALDEEPSDLTSFVNGQILWINKPAKWVEAEGADSGEKHSFAVDVVADPNNPDQSSWMVGTELSYGVSFTTSRYGNLFTEDKGKSFTPSNTPIRLFTIVLEVTSVPLGQNRQFGFSSNTTIEIPKTFLTSAPASAWVRFYSGVPSNDNEVDTVNYTKSVDNPMHNYHTYTDQPPGQFSTDVADILSIKYFRLFNSSPATNDQVSHALELHATKVLKRIDTPVPSGGTMGQALVKKSGTDYDVEWGAAGIDQAAVDARVEAKVPARFRTPYVAPATAPANQGRIYQPSLHWVGTQAQYNALTSKDANGNYDIISG